MAQESQILEPRRLHLAKGLRSSSPPYKLNRLEKTTSNTSDTKIKTKIRTPVRTNEDIVALQDYLNSA